MERLRRFRVSLKNIPQRDVKTVLTLVYDTFTVESVSIRYRGGGLEGEYP